MTTARERLKSLSGLSGSHPARAHLLAITQGSGSGQTIFASMFSVQIEEPRLTLVQRQKIELREAYRPSVNRLSASAEKYASIFTRIASLSVLTTNNELFIRQGSTSSVVVRDLGQERFTVRQSDVLETIETELSVRSRAPSITVAG